MNKILDNERLGIPAGSSPRIQDGLIKRLEQTREKGSMRGELKYAAAKIHRRRIESPTPLRAIPSELSRAESIASDITGRRDQETGSQKARSGVVVEPPERLPKSRETNVEHTSPQSHTSDKRDNQSPSKSEGKMSPQPTREERQLSDSKLENVSDPLGERRKARSVYEEEKLKAYFSRHNSLRYRVQMTGRSRVRTNSGGEEQEEPEKDTPGVKMALESYRESKHKSDDSPFEAEKPSAERKISPSSTQERRVSPVSTLEKRSASETVSPIEKRYPTHERRPSGSKLPSPSRAEVSPASSGSERRTLPDTPPSESSRTRDSLGSSPGSKLERTPPAVPPRPSKILKDSGLRARSPSPSGRAERAKDRCTSPSPMKSRSERSREPSPAGTRSRSERAQEGSPGSEGLSRRGSLRRRTPSTGSEAGGADEQQRSGGSSPQKSSSDELSHSSSASKYSSSESRSDPRVSSRAPTQRGESPSAGRHASPGSSGIPVPTDHSAGRTRAGAQPSPDRSRGAQPSPDRPTTSGTPDDMVRHSRGRRSAREPRNNKKVEVGQRSSSVGAVVDRITGGCCNADTVIVTDKPPMAKRDGSRENLPGHKSSRENIHKGSRENVSSQKPPISRTSSKEDVSGRRGSGRRRTHSEQSAAGSSEDDDGSLPRSGSRESFGERKSSSERSTGSGDMSEALQAALLAPAKTSPREKKPLLKHKR